jgi:filamentous hemagglutinin family protein
MKAPIVLLPSIVLNMMIVGAPITHAQIYQPSNRIPITDNTLGTQVSGSNNNFSITGGVNRGHNLFHSFQDFSIPTGGTATFTNPVGNQSIITRVTGNLFSDLNGLINTQGANFFLLNPHGVVFGPNAQLNVGRVFAASTANSIDLVDGVGKTIRFGTNINGDAPLLSIDPNVFFKVSRFNLAGGNGEIINFGTLQTTNLSQYIGLIGGNISIDGGQINAPGGKIELGGLSAPGSIEFITEGTNPSLNFPTTIFKSNVSLKNQATVNVAGAGDGDIVVNAHNIDLLGDSLFKAGIERGLGTPEAIAGDIRLIATGAIVIEDFNSAVANNVRVNSVGKAGNIIVEADTLSLRAGATIQSFTFGVGHTGDISVKVAGNIDLTGTWSGIDTFVSRKGVGNGGNITIDTGSLSLQNGANLAAVTSGIGNAGNITVNAKNSVSLVAADIASTMEGVGNGGNINIYADSLSMRNGASLAASTFGRGNSGNVTVTAKNSVLMVDYNTTIFANVEAESVGKGGNISIDSASISLQDGAQLISATAGTGNAGNVTLTAKEAISFVGKNTGIFSMVETEGVGTGGNISIDAADSVLLSGTGGLFVGSKSTGGIAGDIIIASPQITLDYRSKINAESLSGNGGNISIGSKPARSSDTNLLILRRGAKISTNADGNARQGGDGGNIQIDAKLIVAIPNENSDITANAVKGRGGNVNINAQGLFGIQSRPQRTNNSDITASSDFGQNGNITINTPGIDPASDTGELPATPTNASNQISRACSPSQLDNKFYITGRGGHPPNPDDLLTNDVIWLDTRAAMIQPVVTQSPQKLAPPAVGWIFDGKGKVTLIAASTEVAATRDRVVCPIAQTKK